MFKKAVLYSALVGLFYQVFCGLAYIFRLSKLYLWLRFYPFPVSTLWYVMYVLGCLVALGGILFFLQNKKNSVFVYLLGKILMLVFLLYAFMENFAISRSEPFIETYLVGIVAWLIYPFLIFVFLTTENNHNNER